MPAWNCWTTWAATPSAGCSRRTMCCPTAIRSSSTPTHGLCRGAVDVESGNSALAERISAELNLGYVSEILCR